MVLLCPALSSIVRNLQNLLQLFLNLVSVNQETFPKKEKNDKICISARAGRIFAATNDQFEGMEGRNVFKLKLLEKCRKFNYCFKQRKFELKTTEKTFYFP